MLRSSLTANSERMILFLPVIFAGGIVFYFNLTVEPPSAVLQFSAVVLAGIAGVSYGKGAGRLARGALVLALFLIGIAWAQERAESRDTVFLDRTRVISGLEGRVTWVERFEGGPRIHLSDLRNWPARAGSPPPTVRIRLKDGPIPEVGQLLRVTARLAPPSRPSYPGAYDFARRAWFDGIGATGFALSAWASAGQGGSTLSHAETFWRFVNRVRQQIITIVRDTDSGIGGAVMAALLTGDRSGIPVAVLEDLRASGLAHLLAISGLHLGLVAGTVFAAVRGVFLLNSRWNLVLPTKKIAAGCALVASFLYLFLAGATIPTQRAFLMTALVLVAVLCDRQAISLRLVALAAAIVLLLAPESVIGPSFQLSFAAVTALVAVYEGWATRSGSAEEWPRRLARYAFFVALTTVIAGLATAPFAIHHFGRIAHYSVLANVLAVPIVTFWVMPLGLLALLLMPLGLHEGPLLLAILGLEGVLWTADQVASLPGATGQVASFQDWGFALIVLGGVWWAIWQGSLRHMGGIALAIGLASLATGESPTLVLHETGRQAGIVWADQLWIEAPRRDRFAQRVWSEKLALPIGGSWRDLASEANSPIRCDPLACLLSVPGQDSVAFIYDPRALPEDCRSATLLRLPIHPHPALCQDRIALTPGRLRREGSITAIQEDGRWRLESVESQRGDRPWTR